MSQDPLFTYLNDHLAGSAAAIDVIDRLIEHVRADDMHARLTGIRAEIQADQHTLEGIIEKLEGQTSKVRHVGGWLAAKAGELKLLFDDPVRGTLGRMQALEMLTIGVHGKRQLWRALSVVQPMVAPLATVDFPKLERRADEQHAAIEQLRLDAVRVMVARQDATREG